MLGKVWTAFLLFGAAASVAAWIAALCHEKGIRPFAGVERFVRGLPWGGRLALLPLFLALVAYGSTKYVGESQGEGQGQGIVVGQGEGERVGESISNHVERVDGCESGFLAQSSQSPQSGDLDRVANVEMFPIAKINSHFATGNISTLATLTTSNSQLTTLNSELITQSDCEDWLKFGGFEDWIYLGPGRWSFRHGSNFVERLAVFSSGKIRLLKQDGGDAWIALSAVPVSIVPEANWGMINFRCRDEGEGEGEEMESKSRVEVEEKMDEVHSSVRLGLPTSTSSLFWHAETPSNTLLLTWCNALLNRDTNSPVNIQAELFPSGGMRITHDLSGELVTEHVPAPELPCADTLDEVLARIEGGNSNAYFFADVAVAKGPAVVKVKSGRETTLGDYSFVAHPGVTNRLPFLIGPEYEVKSEAAYSHFSVTNIEVAVSNLTDRLAAVQWPVKIDFGEGYDFGGGKLFEVAVDPPFLNGIMEFDGNANGNMRMLPRSGGGCGCVVSVTNGAVTVTGVCSNDTCVHEGSYVYEGYRERIELECEMDSDEDPEPEPDDPSSPEEENEPSASVWFEEQAVIFEDEYENAPGETVPRRSTRTTLRCTAYGGERGGNLTVDLSGMNALRLVSGTPPSGRTLAPGEYVEFEAEYEAEKASSQENGTVAKVSFTENETNITFDDEDKMTVVEVTISPMKIARDNMSPGRHKFGVCEIVSCGQNPLSPLLSWDTEYGFFYNEGISTYYSCPLYSVHNPIKVMIGDVELIPYVSVVEPQSIKVENTIFKDYGVHPGIAGYVGMELDLYVSPFDVSFEEIDVEEVPNANGVHIGFFAAANFSNTWYHTSGNGAGSWLGVKADNYYAKDLAAYTESIPKVYLTSINGMDVLGWYYGFISWEVPYGWRQKKLGGKNELPYKQFAQDTKQEFVLDSEGTLTIKKLGSWVSRSTNEVIMIYGAEQ